MGAGRPSTKGIVMRAGRVGRVAGRPVRLLPWCSMSCTTILVGKNASYDGSTIIARDDDSGSGHFTPKKFVVIHPEDQKRIYRSVLSHVPDDCYATIPNQFGIDDFDLADAFGERREYLCSADLREFMAAHHLDRTMDAAPGHFNPRKAFGTATPKDHIYNTPRAWYMQRHLNPSEDWDSPAARHTPESDDIPWCRVPEAKISLEDVDFLLSSHFEGTPYDPYGTLGTAESRHRYRPIGINRTGHMVAIQVRPYAPAVNRTVMWVSFGSGPFTAAAPFYANVNDTPAYLRDTTPEVSTGNLYWANRLIAALADAHFYETSNAIEEFAESARAYGHRLVERTDAESREMTAQTSASESQESAGAADITENASIAIVARLQQSNEEMAEYLRTHVTKLLNDVLYTSSNLMHNSFAMSDRWN